VNNELLLLLGTAASVGIIHTILGPDHYVPFIALAKSGKWSLRKTTFITVACGIGHVLGSVLIGLVGLTFGIALNQLEYIESLRGEIASWLLISFGIIYMIWGIRNIFKHSSHSHKHYHEDGTFHEHIHSHTKNHVHVHEQEKQKKFTPWILFIIFVLGPCEALIPILLYPAAMQSISGVLLVTLTFGFFTVLTMMVIVISSVFSLYKIKLGKFEKFSYLFAGMVITLCGIIIKIFEL
jgi:ABC-type nickel/cobalt efflux system permease component RcnA